jgi:hypothetical protein
MPDQQHEGGSTRVTAHLPGLEIEILHRRSAATSAPRPNSTSSPSAMVGFPVGPS